MPRLARNDAHPVLAGLAVDVLAGSRASGSNGDERLSRAAPPARAGSRRTSRSTPWCARRRCRSGRRRGRTGRRRHRRADRARAPLFSGRLHGSGPGATVPVVLALAQGFPVPDARRPHESRRTGDCRRHRGRRQLKRRRSGPDPARAARPHVQAERARPSRRSRAEGASTMEPMPETRETLRRLSFDTGVDLEATLAARGHGSWRSCPTASGSASPTSMRDSPSPWSPHLRRSPSSTRSSTCTAGRASRRRRPAAGWTCASRPAG